MQYERHDEITYDKGWQKAYTTQEYSPVKGEEAAEEKAEKPSRRKREKIPVSFPTVLVLRLALCLLALGLCLGFKTFGGEKYDELKQLYFENLDNSLFETPSEYILDIDKIFSSGAEQN